MIPERLGKYEIRREIGKGSMGVVYEGYDPLIRRRVAIKVVRDDELDRSQLPELLARLQREAQAAGRLSHPGIVAVYDFGEDRTLQGGHVAYIAMEYVDGGDLRAVLDSGRPLTMPEIARWMGGILAALQHAHDRGVTHRDVKPSNVMTLPDGTIKIADFGVARLDDSELTRTGSMIGTPQYMSPEQLLGLQVDGRSDLFACGVILYQLLTGARPFSGSYATVVQKILNEEPPLPTTINRALSSEWDTVVRKAMAKVPSERYQSAAEFAAAVDRAASAVFDSEATVIRTLPEKSAPPAPMHRGGSDTATVATAAARPAPSSPPRPAPIRPSPEAKKTGGLPWPLVAAAAMGVGGLGLLAALWWPKGSDDVRIATAPAPGLPASTPAALPTLPPPPPVAQAPEAPPPAAPVPVPPPQASATMAPVTPPPAPAPTKVEVQRPGPPPPAVAPKPEAQPSPPPLPMPAAGPAFAADWQVRRDALQAHRGRLGLPAAVALLLDLRSNDDRQKVQAIESLVRERGPHMAAVFGVVNGQLAFAWRSGSTVEQARAAAMARCNELRAGGCLPVMVDGDLRRNALLEVAAALGTVSVQDVRTAFMRSVSAALERAAAAQQAAAPKPAPAPPPVAERPAASPPEPQRQASIPAPPPPATPTPAREWADALAALRAGNGRGSLAGALSVLMAAQRGDEREAFAKFDQAMQRLPWKSALAMSERGGWVHYAWSSREQRSDWAADVAVQGCKRAGGSNCVVVMSDGKFNDAAFLRFAEQLGSRPQATVRDALARAMSRQF